MAKKSEQVYTDPELRVRLKNEITAGDKGGKPGQWSARKAQMLAREYEKAGGGYEGKGERTEAQKHLKKWTEEEWKTADGAPAEQSDGTTRRYLPKEAWEKLSPAEKKATDRKKRAASKKGEQFAPNTAAAKKASKAAREKHGADDDGAKSSASKPRKTAAKPAKSSRAPRKTTQGGAK